MKRVSRDEMRTILEALPPEPADVTIVSKTEPPMRKRDNPYYGKLFKISTASGCIHWQYSHEVNKQRQREQSFEIVDGKPVAKEVDPFEAMPRKWGVRIKDSPFVEHKGVYYLEMKITESQGHEYRDDANELIEGEALKRRKEFFYAKSKKSRQGVKNEIILRDYKFTNITAITLHDSGQTFLIDDSESLADTG